MLRYSDCVGLEEPTGSFAEQESLLDALRRFLCFYVEVGALGFCWCLGAGPRRAAFFEVRAYAGIFAVV